MSATHPAWLHGFAGGVLLLTAGATPAAPAQDAAETDAIAKERAWQLVARHANEAERLVGSPFGRPIALKSSTRKWTARGEAIAELQVGLPALRLLLTQPQRWCEILLLTPSISACGATDGGIDSRYAVKLRYRYDDPDKDAGTATFRFERGLSSPRFLSLQLSAPRGPLGTTDYLLEVEAAPLDEGRTILRVVYTYRYGIRAAAALRFHFATRDRDKLGFSTNAQGQPIRGMRGSLERNVMRHFLAIEAHVLSDDKKPQQRFEKSLDRWLAAIDHYPERLAETDPARYRSVKLEEFGAAR